uniref:MAM domain-containing glycosylphosphatidylinositol anchor protein 1-like n=1 Tax=Myxine glutinosa TaxID=7769 RepID=UPI00358E3865
MDASQSAWQPLLLLLLLGEATAVSHGVYAPAGAYIEATGGACFVRKDGVTERACVVREGDALRLNCIISGHPRPKVRWTKTAGSSSIPEVSVHKEMLYISPMLRTHGGRYYCRAYNAIGVPAIRSIRVDVYYLDPPVLTVHQSVVETKEYFYAERTVFLRCSTMANPHARHSWWRNHEVLSAATDDGLAIYEPLFSEADVNILKLKNLRHQDFANYSCRVSVCGVCGIPDATISFLLSTTTGPPLVYWPLPEQMVVDPGTRVVLPCVVIGGDPSPSVSWDRPSAGLPPGHILSGGNLTLPLVQPHHAGSYHCLVENGVGEPQTRTVQLVVRCK